MKMTCIWDHTRERVCVIWEEENNEKDCWYINDDKEWRSEKSGSLKHKTVIFDVRN